MGLTFILILYITAGTYSTALTSQEFYTQKSCQDAGEEAQKKWDNNSWRGVSFICVKNIKF